MRVLLCVLLFIFAQTGEGKDFDEYEAIPHYKNKLQFHQNYQEPVPFGRITREGFGNPFSSIKQPVQGVEMTLRRPRDKKEALELLKTAKGSQIIFDDPNLVKRYSEPDPQEEMLIERLENPLPEANETMLKWYDLATMQARNAMRPNKHTFIAKKKAPVHRPLVPPSAPGERAMYFPKKSFMLANTDSELNLNWTTCDQFAVGAMFAPKDAVNVKWTPFYVWTADARERDEGNTAAIEHTFEYPTSKLVNEYHLKYSKMVNKTIDWTRAKLLMKGFAEMLLIAADKRGLFHVIVKQEIPDSALTYNLQLPSFTLRLKMEDPYLVMTLCEEYYATVMAVSGNEPTDASEMIAEAATVKFIGPGQPIWRDLERERDKIKAEQDAMLREESEKTITINDPVPPLGIDEFE